jgi:putative transposase
MRRKRAVSKHRQGFDNSVVETFKTLKSELVWRTVFQTRDEAIGRSIGGFYNPVRRPSTLGFVRPVQFEGLAG